MTDEASSRGDPEPHLFWELVESDDRGEPEASIRLSEDGLVLTAKSGMSLVRLVRNSTSHYSIVDKAPTVVISRKK